jgi:HEAT repeats
VIVGQILQIASAVIGLFCALLVAVIVAAKISRGRASIRSKALLIPYRSALIAMACGEDENSQAKDLLYGLPPATWDRLRPSVVTFLTKVRGAPADDLGNLMRSHGEIEAAKRILTSRSAVRRARGAYLLGLVRDSDSAGLVLPLLKDPHADVRLVAARALGCMGESSAALSVLEALRTNHGRIGLPAWVAAEALLAMGVEIGPALQIGLASEDPAVRNVCASVASHGGFLSAARSCASCLRRTAMATSGPAPLWRSGGSAMARMWLPSRGMLLRPR